MDIFGGVDIDAIRKKLDAGVSLDDQAKAGKESKTKTVSDSKLEAKWLEGKGLYISIPESLLDEMGWVSSTKLEMIVHDNVLVLYPLNGFLNLRKISGKTGKSVLVPKENFGNSSKMSEMTETCTIWEDDVTAYHRLMIQFSETIPTAFIH